MQYKSPKKNEFEYCQRVLWGSTIPLTHVHFPTVFGWNVEWIVQRILLCCYSCWLWTTSYSSNPLGLQLHSSSTVKKKSVNVHGISSANIVISVTKQLIHVNQANNAAIKKTSLVFAGFRQWISTIYPFKQLGLHLNERSFNGLVLYYEYAYFKLNSINERKFSVQGLAGNLDIMW